MFRTKVRTVHIVNKENYFLEVPRDDLVKLYIERFISRDSRYEQGTVYLSEVDSSLYLDAARKSRWSVRLEEKPSDDAGDAIRNLRVFHKNCTATFN